MSERANGGWGWVQKKIFWSFQMPCVLDREGGTFEAVVELCSRVLCWFKAGVLALCRPDALCLQQRVYDIGWCHELSRLQSGDLCLSMVPFVHLTSHFGTVKCVSTMQLAVKGTHRSCRALAWPAHGGAPRSRDRRRIGVQVRMISRPELVPVFSFFHLMATTENSNILKRLAFSSQSPMSLPQSKDTHDDTIKDIVYQRRRANR